MRIYNDPDLKLGACCNHSFYTNCKINFLIDILRIEFAYHPVGIYSLDLICFKDQEGSLSKNQLKENFDSKKKLLLTNIDEVNIVLKDSIASHYHWLK